jgi:hypothetical protein
MDWIHLVEDRDQWRTLVVIILQVPKKIQDISLPGERLVASHKSLLSGVRDGWMDELTKTDS